MGIRTEHALAAVILTTAAAPELAHFDPTSVAQAQTMEQTVPAPAPDPELLKFCLKEATGVETDAQLAAFNPAAESVNSRYIGHSLRRFGASVVANAISDDCLDVVTGRTYTVAQFYKGKNNMPKDQNGEPIRLVFNGLGKMTGEPLTKVTLRVPFAGIKGPKRVRSYQVRATETVTTTAGTFVYNGRGTVRGNTDGV